MGRLLRSILFRLRDPAPAFLARLVAWTFACLLLAAALFTGSSTPALAVKASPPTAVCTGKCEACIECENDNGKCRCVKCGVDPACLGDGGLSWEFTEMLKAHNGFRARHGVPPLS